MNEYISKIKSGENLAQEEIEDVMTSIMSNRATKEDMAEFLLALREKGPTIDEITGAARIMRSFVVKVEAKSPRILDTCGTGGDKKHTFNISTIAGIVAAGAGAVVAKHGNRSVSSKCGSADVLEAMGINIKAGEKHAAECMDDVGIAFLFAQVHHPAMKHVAPVRKELGVDTIFNILGPLTNPANATHQMVGVYRRDLVEPIANVLKNLGLKRALVVHGSDGLDEITTTGKTFVSEYNGKEIISYDVDPEELGIKIARPEDIIGGDLKTNVEIAEAVIRGERGPKRDIVLLNAAYALYISEKVKGISDAMEIAREAIDSGKASQTLERLREFSNRIEKIKQ
jgi:anthranilate phosphoribosyltransferase